MDSMLKSFCFPTGDTVCLSHKEVCMMLGSRVREARERLGLSQDKLAQQVRIERNTLWYIEAGRTKHPRADQVAALAQALHVSADYLLGLTEDPAPPTKRPRPRKAAPID